MIVRRQKNYTKLGKGLVNKINKSKKKDEEELRSTSRTLNEKEILYPKDNPRLVKSMLRENFNKGGRVVKDRDGRGSRVEITEENQSRKEFLKNKERLNDSERRELSSLNSKKHQITWNKSQGIEGLGHEMGHTENVGSPIRTIRNSTRKFENSDNIIVGPISRAVRDSEERKASKSGLDIIKRNGGSDKEIEIARETYELIDKKNKSISKIKNKETLAKGIKKVDDLITPKKKNPSRD